MKKSLRGINMTTSAPCEEQSKKKSGKTKAILAIICAVVILAGVFLFKALTDIKFSAQTGYALFVQNGELYQVDGEGNTLQVTTNFLEDKTADMPQALAQSIVINEDKTRIFFPDNTAAQAKDFSLYYRDLKEKPVQIAARVTQYFINQEGTQVVYLSDGSLYHTNLVETVIVGEEVTMFYAASDVSRVVYLDKKDDCYLWQDGTSELIAENVVTLEYNQDISDLYYIDKNATLYHRNDKGENVVSGQANDILKIYETGQMYYTQTIEATIPIKDDIKDEDAILEEPEQAAYKEVLSEINPDDYDNDKDYEQAKIDAVLQYNKTHPGYQEEANVLQTEYEAKQMRDELRQNMVDGKLTVEKQILFYYDGITTSEVTGAMILPDTIEIAQDAPYLFITAQEDESTLWLSNLNTPEDINIQRNNNATRYVVAEDNIIKADIKASNEVLLEPDGKKAYYIDEIGELHSITISKTGVSAPEYLNNIVEQPLQFTEKGDLTYYTNNEWGVANVCIGRSQRAQKVTVNSAAFTEDAMTYFTNWNQDKAYGELMILQGDTTTQIAEKVTRFDAQDKSVFYCKANQLYVYANGMSVEIAVDAIMITPSSTQQGILKTE